MLNGASPLRAITKELIGRIGQADLVIGIPSFNNADTIGGVVRAAAAGLAEHFPGRSSAIIIADGGSTTDDTREIALSALKETGAHGVVGIYRGLSGKGSAVRMIFAAAQQLGAHAVALMDSDLRSVTPTWVDRLLRPVVNDGFEFVAPLYARYKYDGTITNNVTYNMLRCLYGKRVRQPIGGEFALSGQLARELEAQPVWEGDVARFGIDIWLTIQAMTRSVKMCQTHLGVKVHDVKDPGASLEPMFRQVVGTLFALMESTEEDWRAVRGSNPVPVWGQPTGEEPEAFPIDYERLVSQFFVSWRTLRGAWEAILLPDTAAELAAHVESGPKAFYLPTDLWVRVLFEFAAAFHARSEKKRQVIEVLSPLYFARVASFMQRTAQLTTEEAEAVVEEQARVFELRKDDLIEAWDRAAATEKTA